jgi:predicted ATPase
MVRFKGWEVRPLERVVLVNGEAVHLGSRAFDVLMTLVERQGGLVTKDEMLKAAWPHMVVEENNVSVQIATLRKVLGGHAIATVAGVGYRLAVAPEDAPPPPPRGAFNGGVAAHARVPATPMEPMLTLIGREADLRILGEQVGAAPLVTIVGTGGVGKTALARAVLGRFVAAKGEDAHWIDLAPVRDGAQFIPLVAQRLGVELGNSEQPAEDLVGALSRARALVAVDNCEHLLGHVAALVARAIEGAPGVRWLATSQEPLHVQGERIHRLAPLEVPASDATLDEAMRCGAMVLLRQRVSDADRHGTLDETNLAAAISVCRHLDGLPLAIEMVASRVATLGLTAVQEQLGRRLSLLTGPRAGPSRHHTLGSTFDWSYGLLSEAEQSFFRCLQPFLGGFTAAMAGRAARGAGDEDETLAILSALVDKSLVHRSADAPGRFFLFESAREHALRRLAAAGETASARQRHAQATADAFDSARADLARLGDSEWAALYIPERHNARGALAWACEVRDPNLIARLVAALAQLDLIVVAQAEVVQCEIPMDVLESAEPSLRAHACLQLSWAQYSDGSRELGTRLAMRALEDFEALGDVGGAYQALAQLSRLYESRPGMLEQAHDAWQRLGRIDEHQVPLRTRLSCTITAGLQHGRHRTIARLQELEQLTRRSGFEALASICRAHITDELLIQGRFDEAATLTGQIIEAGEHRPRVKGMILNNQALALVQLGRVREAYEPARAGLRALPSAAHMIVDTFALAVAREGRFLDAALLAGYGDKIRRDRDKKSDPAEEAVIAETGTRLREALGAEHLDETMRIGAAMSTGDILAIALPE